MTAYLLNILFPKQAPSAAKGLFNSDSPNSPSARSKVWYTVPTTQPQWPTTGVPAEASQLNEGAPVTNWTTITPDKSVFNATFGDDIYIRMVPDSSWGPNPGLQLRFTAVFGRPATSGHSGDTIASPFVLTAGAGDGENGPCTLYTTDTASGTGEDQDYTNPGPDGSWIYYLGQPQQNAAGQVGHPKIANRTCVYSFIVGATVIQTVNGEQDQYTYGHDPQMDVNG